MSSPGIPQNGLANVLMLARPDLAAQQQALATRRAFAESLLSSPPSQFSGPGGALDTAGSRILGAILEKNANKRSLDLANQQRAALFDADGQGPTVAAAQQSASPAPPLGSIPAPLTSIAATPGQPNSGAQMRALPPLGSLPPGGLENAAPSSAQQPGGPSRGQPVHQSLFDQAVPDIPGIDPRNKFVLYASDPANYMKGYYASIGLTDAEKNTAEAFGRGTPEYNQQMQQLAAKNSAILLRQGQGGIVNGKFIAMPNAQGAVPSIGQDGTIRMDMAPGAAEAERTYSSAKAAGQAQERPAVGYDNNNQPVATNQFTMAHGGLTQPASQASAAPFGAPIGESIVKGLFPGATITSGQRTPEHNAAVGGVPDSQHLGSHAVDFVLPHGKTFADVKQAFAASGLPASELIDEGSHIHWAWGDKPQGAQGGPLLPELPAGQKEFMAGQGKEAEDRYSETIKTAADSPTRINVLDNIIGLSKQGVASGPTAQWVNDIKGVAQSIPGFGAWKNDVSGYQELQKFTYQNGVRAWQAAGGTGTDKQMEALAVANPNTHMNPQALQAIAQWSKAGELAVQAKANAQDRYLQQNGNTPANQAKFESTWRNSFDPHVFQYSLMSPQERQAFAHHVLKTPQEAKSFLAKQQQLKALGAPL